MYDYRIRWKSTTLYLETGDENSNECYSHENISLQYVFHTADILTFWLLPATNG